MISVPRVAVIGAGLSGLTAAQTLRSFGIEVSIFEARDRIGGRILTVQLAHWPEKVEAGARFIGACHGETLKLCELHNVDLADRFSSSTERLLPGLIYYDGRELGSGVQETLELEFEWLFNEVSRRAKEMTFDDIVNPFGRYWSLPLTKWLRQIGASDLAIEFFSDAIEGTQTVSTLLAAVKVSADGYFDDFEKYSAVDGLFSLVRRIAEHVGFGRIHLGQMVTKIAEVTESIEIQTRNSKLEETSYHFDAVIVAIPPQCVAEIAMDLEQRECGKLAKHRYLYFVFESLSEPSQLWFLSDSGPVRTASVIWRDGRVLVDVLSRDASASIDSIEQELRTKLGIGHSNRCLEIYDPEWIQDPWSLGTYAMYSVRPPVTSGQSRISFAGDWLGWPHVGFMEGAIISGQRAAAEVNLLIQN